MSQFLDTNILLYSIGRSPAESHKPQRTIELLDDDTSAKSIPVLQEFMFSRQAQTALTHVPTTSLLA
jgi:predicted nucleic acid-binding protein